MMDFNNVLAELKRSFGMTATITGVAHRKGQRVSIDVQGDEDGSVSEWLIAAVAPYAADGKAYYVGGPCGFSVCFKTAYGPGKHSHCPRHEFEGEQITLREIARRKGLSATAMYNRVVKRGLSRAIHDPVSSPSERRAAFLKLYFGSASPNKPAEP